MTPPASRRNAIISRRLACVASERGGLVGAIPGIHVRPAAQQKPSDFHILRGRGGPQRADEQLSSAVDLEAARDPGADNLRVPCVNCQRQWVSRFFEAFVGIGAGRQKKVEELPEAVRGGDHQRGKPLAVPAAYRIARVEGHTNPFDVALVRGFVDAEGGPFHLERGKQPQSRSLFGFFAVH
jgi:hypothetical protein